MRITRNWLVTMFDAEKRKERLFFHATSAVEALHKAAQTLELSTRLAATPYSPVEVHVQVLTLEEARVFLDQTGTIRR